jgi:integrase
MRKSLSDKGVAALKPRPKRYAFPDPELRGHYVRVQSSGVKTFTCVASAPDGKQVWTAVGSCDAMTIADARAEARKILTRVRAGMPAREPRATAFAAVAGEWMQRHVQKNGLRSEPEIKRLLSTHVLPAWGDREFLSIRRSDVAALLDSVEDNHGARQADYVLNIVRSLMNWYATRHDDYNPPIVRGMRRQSPHACARARILDDAEIQAIWKATEDAGAYGGLIRLALLTAQRFAKVAGMRWSELSGDEWTIPREPREKDTGGVLVLPALALDVLAAQRRLGDNPHVFAGRGDSAINGFSKSKARLDAASGVTGWRFHDLRRTARSLMSRAGVRPDIAERVMGHAIVGVEGVYDRFSYLQEKADALRRLASLIEEIVRPSGTKVVRLRRHRHDAR